MNEPRWTFVELPQPVKDDELPRSTFYIVNDGVIVAQVVYGGESMSYDIVKRLNQWEMAEFERHRQEAIDLGILDEMGQ